MNKNKFMKIDRVNIGLCQWRATNNKPPYFVNWIQGGKNQYKFFDCVSSCYSYKELLINLYGSK